VERERSGPKIGWSGRDRKRRSGSGAQGRVVGTGGERAKSAAHSLLTVGRERGDRFFLLTTGVVFIIHSGVALVEIC